MPDHMSVEQGIINFAYCFGDDLLTILGHDWSCVDLIWSNICLLNLNTSLKLIHSLKILWCEMNI